MNSLCAWILFFSCPFFAFYMLTCGIRFVDQVHNKDLEDADRGKHLAEMQVSV